MKKIDENGFALTEALLALPVLAVAIAGVMMVVYLSVAQAWLKDAGEEAALCVAEKIRVSVCKRELVHKTRTVLPIGAYTRLSIEKSASHVVVKYVFQAAEINLENEIKLRLPVSKSAVGI